MPLGRAMHDGQAFGVAASWAAPHVEGPKDNGDCGAAVAQSQHAVTIDNGARESVQAEAPGGVAPAPARLAGPA